MSRLLTLLLIGLLPAMVQAAEPLSPDQLLQRIRSERAAEVDAMQAREQAFIRNRSEQAQLLARANARLKNRKPKPSS